MTLTQGSASYRFDYLYDEEGTPYGCVYRSPASSTSPVYFTILTDEHGNVRELLDAAGNPFATYNYGAYGALQGSGSYWTGEWYQSTSLINSTLAGTILYWQPLTYAGYVYDQESNMYYCNARYYDVGSRQWTTADPAGADGQESTYQYCGGDPVAGSDPTGQAELTGRVYATCNRCWSEDKNMTSRLYADYNLFYGSDGGSHWFVYCFQWFFYSDGAGPLDLWASTGAYSDVDNVDPNSFDGIVLNSRSFKARESVGPNAVGDDRIGMAYWGDVGESVAQQTEGDSEDNTGNQYIWWPDEKTKRSEMTPENHEVNGSYVYFNMEIYYGNWMSFQHCRWEGYVGGVYNRVYLPK